MKFGAFYVLVALSFCPAALSAQQCIECHKKTTPNIVSDWQLSKHSQNDVGCSVCHGEEHNSVATVAKAKVPTPRHLRPVPR